MFKLITSVALLICAFNGFTAQQYHIGDRTGRDGYYSESHAVTTSDGYILDLQRIPFRRFETPSNAAKTSKPVVFLMHGLQSNSLCYIFMGPDLALAYLLAEAGYDVWMGNARGGLNSRRHVKLNPDTEKKAFFDYSFEDIGTKDVPEMIDYILGVTGEKQLHYIGHSQGGTAFLVMNSVRTEYNEKIKSAHLLAGVGYMNNFPNRLLRTIAFSVNLIYSFAVNNGIVEVLGPEDKVTEGIAESTEKGLLDTLLDAITSFFGDSEMLAPASMKQYAHFGQNIKDRTFGRWNYGPIENLHQYGSINAPTYDLGKITAKTIMHYTVNDDLLDEKDVISMASVMPNTTTRKIARESYTHSDFVIAPDSKELVYDFIIDELNKASK